MCQQSLWEVQLGAGNRYQVQFDPRFVPGTGSTENPYQVQNCASFVYDYLDRLTKTTYPDGKVVQAAYDDAGNRVSFTNPLPTTTTYGYDAANRLTSMTQGSLTWTFGYDAAGNRTSLGQPNGATTTYAYLNNDWLSSITHKAPGGATLQSFAYTYDANGNRITQADPTGTTTYGYDALNRLVNAAYPAGYGSWTWQYDPVGNRLVQTSPSGTTNYSYDANNRLLSVGGVNYNYDANGNLTSTSSGQSFAWDIFNRMTSATGGGGTATYTYNGDGLKIRRIGPDGTTRYYYDGIRPIWEADGAGSMTAQLDRDIFGNLLSRKEPAGTRRYYHFDGLGSTTGLSDESGVAVATLFYDAWGNQRLATGTMASNYRFTGAELDSASGLYHMGSRFYDPVIGRWLSEDSVQDKHFVPESLNFYVYAASNPANLIDSAGDAPEVFTSSWKVSYWDKVLYNLPLAILVGIVTGFVGYAVAVGWFGLSGTAAITIGGASGGAASAFVIGIRQDYGKVLNAYLGSIDLQPGMTVVETVIIDKEKRTLSIVVKVYDVDGKLIKQPLVRTYKLPLPCGSTELKDQPGASGQCI